jgi:hypothetical protein
MSSSAWNIGRDHNPPIAIRNQLQTHASCVIVITDALMDLCSAGKRRKSAKGYVWNNKSCGGGRWRMDLASSTCRPPLSDTPVTT